MQRALVHFSGGNYDEFVVRDQHLRCFIRRANTADLLKNTEYSPELIRTLHSKYASWVQDVITRPCSNPVRYNAHKLLANIFNLPSVSTLWEYLYLFNYIPPLSGYEKLHLIQTGNGTPYWHCFVPTEYFG